VQGNHLHLVVEAEGAHALSRAMQGLGVRIARGLNRELGRRGTVLADRYHARALETPREVRNTLAYVLLNRAHHTQHRYRSASSLLHHDPYSSGSLFDGWPRTLEAVSRGPDDEVAPPRVWLLAKGWRRHGLIHPNETPGATP